ncbi:drebrin isoform X1 [Amia ocellicauda]|uniref:drebrin isoform X1 n=1 Tax=Amia ocellicauda TaxID=2972642 RepID=UPI003464E63E
MAVNLSKNRLALLTAYQDVISETSSNDWALYTYEDNTNDLMLASTGAGGLPEITVCFDNTRVMYGFCSIKEATSALPRYILINWVGEDVADARKCACASHVATIAEFFQVSVSKGVDVIINASSIEDIDPSAIGQRLTNGMGPVASPVLSRLRMRDEEQTESVGTCYQKTNAEIEMKKINREEFWEQAKREEELRKEEERRKAAEERQRFEEERMEQERKEQEERERRYREREQQIEEHRKLQSQEAEEAKERTRDTSLFVEAENEAGSLEKKESEVEEAAAIIAQRAENPREFFRQKEKAVACSFDSSPVSCQRTGRLDSPFLKLQHSLPEPSSSPPRSPLLSPALPHVRLQPGLPDDNAETSPQRSPGSVSPTPIPKIVTTPIMEETEEEPAPEIHDEWELEPVQLPPVQDPSPAKPVQSVAPQARETPPSAEMEVATFHDLGDQVPSPLQESDGLLDLWESPIPQPPVATSQEPLPVLVDLMETSPQASPSTTLIDLATTEEHPTLPQTLLSFDDLPEPPTSFCEGPVEDDDPSSLVDVAGPHQMTLSYQHALQQASGSDSQDLEDSQLLMTNGETVLKEGTQASEGYFSQSQEEEFAQSEECSAKVTPMPVFYNKPPEIDITCWDNDPVTEEDDYGAAE